MKNLHEYLMEHMVMESFKSNILRDFWMGLQKRGRNNGSYFNMLQWDKITDDDLKKLTKDEAIKRMRSRKDPGYLLWISDRTGTAYGRSRHTKDGWVDEPDTTFHYNGATWGCDVCLTYDGDKRDVKAIHIADDADYAYEVIDPTRFLVKDIQFARRKAREGALALMDAYRIAEKNRERYRDALANMRTPDVEKLIPKFEEISEMYKNVASKYAQKVVEYLQEGTPSYYDLINRWAKINEYFNKIIERLHKVKEYKGQYDEWALRASNEFSQLVVAFEKQVNDYLEKIK